MGYGVKVEVWGDYALFSRPELKVERFSYEVMTPSAAKGILKAIYWHPGVEWIIDRIVVRKPIKFTTIKRNEVKSKISAKNVISAMDRTDKVLALYTGNDIAQRSSTLLQDVRYVIEAHFELGKDCGKDDTPEKIYNIVSRRIRKGQCYYQPYLGCREFSACFGEPPETYAPLEHQTRQLGLMLYDMDFSDPNDISPCFFNAVLKDGVLDVRDCEVLR
ncbi:MAG: type I-C CRISPR-associated protein Cas5c [Spirochaetia bacterium]|jgi:CRISPR-associated protein Cas5d|nr:type I-C CRISPR-associated protein Cas5c [Spirochaetia bacterium]